AGVMSFDGTPPWNNIRRTVSAGDDRAGRNAPSPSPACPDLRPAPFSPITSSATSQLGHEHVELRPGFGGVVATLDSVRETSQGRAIGVTAIGSDRLSLGRIDLVKYPGKLLEEHLVLDPTQQTISVVSQALNMLLQPRHVLAVLTLVPPAKGTLERET